MSKTPICDRWEYDTNQGGLVVPLNVAKDLETELAEARAEIERLKEYTTCTLESADANIDDKDVEIIKRDKLIEQMREALKAAKQLLVDLDWIENKAGDAIKAALAAERGE
jgi:cell division septum initiation protein DivIVA